MGGDALERDYRLNPTRVLVCGGREFNDRKQLNQILDGLCIDRGWQTPKDEYGNWLPNIHIITGMARGADSLALDYAVVNWITWSEFPADWEKYGRAAGAIRNQQMLEEGKPDVVVAFQGGRGTAHMVGIAKKAGVEVIEV